MSLPSDARELLQWMQKQKEREVPLTAIPEKWRNGRVLTTCAVDGLLSWGTRTHCFTGEIVKSEETQTLVELPGGNKRPRVEDGWSFNSLDPGRDDLPEAIDKLIADKPTDPRIAIHVKLTGKAVRLLADQPPELAKV